MDYFLSLINGVYNVRWEPASTIDADSVYAQGKRLKPTLYLQQTVWNGEKLNLPSGHDISKAIWRFNVVESWYDNDAGERSGENYYKEGAG